MNGGNGLISGTRTRQRGRDATAAAAAAATMGPFEFMFKAAALAGNLCLGLGALTKVRTNERTKRATWIVSSFVIRRLKSINIQGDPSPRGPGLG